MVSDLPELHLPVSLQNVTKYHEDFVKCEDQDTANKVMESMQHQWSELAKPGRKVKVKMKDELSDGIIDKSYFISKLSFDSRYFYATAKAEVKLADTSSIRELQLRELKFCQYSNLVS